MSYTQWVKDLSALPKSAEFCLADVSERISYGDKVIHFLITEAAGADPDPFSRRGSTKVVSRPRIYLGVGDLDMNDPLDGRIEIMEPVGKFDKHCINEFSFSPHEFYLMQSKLCESVLDSLTKKIEVINERSTALLESHLGDEVLKLITAKLEGVDVGMENLKSLLAKRIIGAYSEKVIVPLGNLMRHNNQIDRLDWRENNDLSWRFELVEAARWRFSFLLIWKNVSLIWNGEKSNILGPLDAVCTRDTFLYLVNLDNFAQMVCARLSKVMQ